MLGGTSAALELNWQYSRTYSTCGCDSLTFKMAVSSQKQPGNHISYGEESD